VLIRKINLMWTIEILIKVSLVGISET